MDIADTLSDPLTLLRRFTMTKQPVKLVGDYLVFGRVRFPRAAPTAYRASTKGKPFYPVDAHIVYNCVPRARRCPVPNLSDLKTAL